MHFFDEHEAASFITASEKNMRKIFRPKQLIRKVPLDSTDLDPQIRHRRGLYSEWIITNALGGYASGTIGGLNTRQIGRAHV